MASIVFCTIDVFFYTKSNIWENAFRRIKSAFRQIIKQYDLDEGQYSGRLDECHGNS